MDGLRAAAAAVVVGAGALLLVGASPLGPPGSPAKGRILADAKACASSIVGQICPAAGGGAPHEATLSLAGPYPQIGWATSGFAPGNGNGVGDDASSWGADGVRGLLWHNGTEGWTIRWEDGDTIGCAADLEGGKIWFGRNGVWAVAFEGCRSKWEAGLYPAITGTSMSFAVNSTPRFAGPTPEFQNIGRLPLQLCDESYTGFLFGDVQRA